MPPTKRGRGRPKILPKQASVKLAVDQTDLDAAEQLVAEFDRTSPLGIRHSRIDVLRAAISRGIASLRADVGTCAKPTPATSGVAR